MDLLLNELNVNEIDSLKREIWPLLRTHKVKPLEILPFIRGLSENDIIDNLYEALRRRNLDCFKRFLLLFLNMSMEIYGWQLWRLVKKIIKKKSPTLRTIEILTQVNNSQRPTEQLIYREDSVN